MPGLRRAVPVLLLLVLACQNGPPPPPRPAPTAGPQVLRVAVATLPTTFDPALAPVYDSAGTRAVFETLVRPRADLGGVVPAAASAWTIAGDGLTYDFTLRSNARWSDGRPVRAAEFVSAWKRLLDPRVNSPAAEILAPLLKGAAGYVDLDPKTDAARIPAFLEGLGLFSPDDLTFRVVLANPSLALLWAATMPATAPVRADNLALGNGPFRVREATREHVDLEPNPGYWGRRSRLARIVLFVRGDAVADIERFARGEEEVTSLTTEGIDAFLRTPALARNLSRTPALQVWWLEFNVHRPPFDRPSVRLAFARAIDREALVQGVLKGLGLPLTGLVPKGMSGYRPGLEAQRFDPPAARAALRAAAVPATEIESVHLLVRDLPWERQVGEAVVAQIRANLGVSLVLDMLPSPKVSKKVVEGDFQVAGPAGWIADFPEPQDFVDLFVTNGHGQYSRYSSATYDQLVALGDRSLDPDQRRRAYDQAQQLLVEDAPVAFLFQVERWSLVGAAVAALTPTPLDDWPGSVQAQEIHLRSP